MNLDLTDEAAEFGQLATRALESAGDGVATVLADLGAWELDPRAGADELEAAAALCRAAGWAGTSHPVAERVAGVVVVARPGGATRLAGLDVACAEVTVDGDPRDVSLGLVLPCWTLLGMLDRAMELTRAYVLERQQFGQPLASFQGVQFQLTDAEVERTGLDELARYALWSIEVGLDDAVDDALALRLAAIDAADVVFRVCHQLHGAIGFCDEMPLSWLSRYSQPLRRLPLGLSATRAARTGRLGRRGLVGLFNE